ncbi:MAG: hypothetical protein FIB06_01620 [Betaproteobacteria bacterium]|nr:hypothetical protein [Betaproteobacteria bacterium]
MPPTDISPKQRKLLKHLAKQAEAVRTTGRWTNGPDLVDLLFRLRLSKPRAKSVRYAGMKLPIAHSLCARIVCCPLTGRELVGVAGL